MSDESTFGRRLIALGGIQQRVELEREETRREEFADLDSIIEETLMRALAGERILRLGRRHDDETVEFLDLGDSANATLAECFDVEAMESRGAWALPKRETIPGGTINLAWWTRHEPRFLSSLAGDEKKKVDLRGNPTAVFVWSVLAPIFELLAIPHELRSAKLGKADVATQEKQWERLDALLEETGLEMSDELSTFRPHGGWSVLSVTERVEARLALADAWKRNASPETAVALRMWAIGGLLERYYSKAKKGAPRSRQVLTKAFWRPLVGYFGGDWLAFLRYLGEEPSAAEEIVTSLPEPKLYVGGEDRARQAAAAAGVEPAEVELMLSSFYGGGDVTSPIERRVEVLKRTWHEVDALHAAQVPGGRNMWGLLDERDDPFDDRWDGYVFGLHRELLSSELNRDIHSEWGTEVIGRVPERLVTRVLPHAGAVDAFGPALVFWHKISLAAFGNTEGLTYFDYGLIEIADKYREELGAMEELGHSVDPRFFKDLTTAAHRLGDPQPEGEERSSRHEIGSGLAIEITMSGLGSRGRRAGFEQLRDVVTAHRRAWAEEHLDAYLRARWEADLRMAAEVFNRSLQAKGKPPTVRQTITASKATIDRWFAGDAGALLTAIGQKRPSTMLSYERVMPVDVYEFGESVHRNLGLVEEPEVSDWSDTAAVSAQRAARTHNTYRRYAAERAYEYVRRWEALGRPPEMKEVPGAKGAMKWLDPTDPEAAWRQFVEAVQKAIEEVNSMPAPQPAHGKTVDAAADDSPVPSDSGSISQPSGEGRERGLLGRLRGLRRG